MNKKDWDVMYIIIKKKNENEALEIELEKGKNMYGMFIYYDKKRYNNTVIRGSLKDLHKQIEIISEDLLKKEKEAIIEIKLWNIVREDTTKD
jgi:hypothetical protein